LTYPKGKWEGFLAKFSPLGSALTYSTTFGSEKNDGAVDAALDAEGNAYVLAGSDSALFPITPGAYDNNPNFADGYDMVIMKMTMPRVPFGTVNYGASTPGCQGEHLLRTEKAVAFGDPSITFTCTRAPQNSLGLILLGDTQDLTGSNSLYIGLPIHVGLSPGLIGIDIPSASSSLAHTTLTLPDLAPLIGQTFYAQAFWYWQSSQCVPSLFGLSASNGLAITVQP